MNRPFSLAAALAAATAVPFAARAAPPAATPAAGQVETGTAAPYLPPPPILWVPAVPPPPPPEPPIIYLPPPPPADARALPPPARAMIEQAMQNGRPEDFAAVAALAKRLYPDGVQQIEALSAEQQARVAEKAAAAARAHADMLAAASFLELWKGEAEIGGSRSTGNTDLLALYAAVNINREGLRWRHQFTARGDLQRTTGITSAERINAAWQPNYKIDDRLYAYGLGQYDHDRFLNIANRYTVGAGVGYSVVARPDLNVKLEGGPAARYTDLYDEAGNPTLAARASLNVAWRVTPTFSITQGASAFLESGGSNATATTAVDAKLIGPLKARLSYNLTYERAATEGTRNLDTVSRAALVYSF